MSSASLPAQQAEEECASNADSVSSGTASTRSCWKRFTKYFLDPRRSVHRYLLLLCACMFIPGPYFADALLATMKGPLQSEMGISNTDFGMLFAFSTLTGIVCGPAGVLFVRIGRTRVALVASLFCTVGSLFVTLGFMWQNLTIMIVARVVFWLSLYAVLTVQTLLVYSIFEEDEVTFAYSFVITACRLGSVFSYFASGPIILRFGVKDSLWISTVFVAGGFVAAISFCYFFRGSATAQAVRPLLSPRIRSQGRTAGSSGGGKIVKRLPGYVWLLPLSLLFLYGYVFPFEVIATDMLQTDFGYGPDEAGYLLSMVPLLPCFTPLVAPMFSGPYHWKLRWATGGFVLLTCAQLTLLLEQRWSCVLAFFLMSVAYTISTSNLFSVVPALVATAGFPKEERMKLEGLVSGLNYTFIAIGQASSNMAVGLLKDAFSYQIVRLWFLTLGCLGSLCVFSCLLLAPKSCTAADQDINQAVSLAEGLDPHASFHISVADGCQQALQEAPSFEVQHSQGRPSSSPAGT